jgi:hypothetical protein
LETLKQQGGIMESSRIKKKALIYAAIVCLSIGLAGQAPAVGRLKKFNG